MSFTLSTGNVAYPSASTEVTASDGDSCTIKITASCYLSNGWVQSTGVVAKFYVDGVLKSTQTLLGNGTKYTASAKKTKTYSYTVNRAHASKTSKWKVQFHQYTDGVDQGMKVYINGTRTISAQTSYAIKYNANGGTGAPANQTKWYGDTLVLSSDKPTRTGYTFSKWNTASGGTGTAYSAGGSYTANAAATLYAQWTANTYTVTFKANGGTCSTTSLSKTYNGTITLPTPTRTNYTFKGWATSATATSGLAAGASYTVTGNTTLYALWELAYYKPRANNFKVIRCNSSGTADDYGTYLKVTFNIDVCTLTSSTNVLKTVAFEWTGDSTNDASYTESRATGAFSKIIGGSISSETTHTLKTILTDNLGGTTTITKTIGVATWPIDLYGGDDGNGVTVGAVATGTGFNVFMPSKFNDEITMANFKRLYWLNNAGAKRSMVVLNNENDYFFGYDSYNNSEGTTYFDGNNVMVRSKNGVEFSANDTAGRIESNIPFRTFARCETCSTEVSTLSTSAKIAKCETLQYNTSLGYLTNNNGAIVCNRAGVVLVMAQAYFQGLTAGDTVSCQVWRNGATVGGGRASAGGNTVSATYPPRIMSVSAGDYFDIRVLNATAARGKVAAGSATSLTIMYIA